MTSPPPRQPCVHCRSASPRYWGGCWYSCTCRRPGRITHLAAPRRPGKAMPHGSRWLPVFLYFLSAQRAAWPRCCIMREVPHIPESSRSLAARDSLFLLDRDNILLGGPRQSPTAALSALSGRPAQSCGCKTFDMALTCVHMSRHANWFEKCIGTLACFGGCRVKVTAKKPGLVMGAGAQYQSCRKLSLKSILAS